MTLVLLFDLARAAIGGLFILAGSVLMLGAAIGLLRFPDVFTRLHSAGGALAMGVCISLAGLLCLATSPIGAAKLAFLTVLIGAAAPVLSHFVGSAAHAAGISPIVGDYTAPRPGERKGAQ